MYLLLISDEIDEEESDYVNQFLWNPVINDEEMSPSVQLPPEEVGQFLYQCSVCIPPVIEKVSEKPLTDCIDNCGVSVINIARSHLSPIQ